MAIGETAFYTRRMIARGMRARLRVGEAMLALVAAKVILRGLPWRWLGWLTGPVDRAATDLRARPGRRDAGTAGVAWAIRIGARKLPWHSSCLTRALAARMMLRRRGVESTLIVGVASDAAGFRAHAWLISGGGTVCGGRESREFHPLAAFRR